MPEECQAPVLFERQGKTSCPVSAPTCRKTGVSSWGGTAFRDFCKIRLTKFKLFDIITNVSGGFLSCNIAE